MENTSQHEINKIGTINIHHTEKYARLRRKYDIPSFNTRFKS